MGLIKGAVRLGIGALLFVGGYMFNSYVHGDERYSVQRVDDVPYLMDKRTERRLRIYEGSMQVGSLEHRLEGVLQDPRMTVALEQMEMRYQDHD